MRSIVLYFSQTGNTKKVAMALRGAIKAEGGQCDIVRLQEADVGALAGYDLIGIGCPTFLWEEPENVKRFIRSMWPLKGNLCFAFATHGGHPGDVISSMAAKLRRQGLSVIGGFNCDGWDRMPHYTYPWFTDGHPDEIDLQAAAEFGKEMVEKSRRIFCGEKVPRPRFERIRKNFLQFLTSTVNKPVSRGFLFDMTLDKSNCRYPRCHLCMDNCPVNAIDLSADPIVFRKGCISCYFCDMICPTGAIEPDPVSVAARRESRIQSLYDRHFLEFFERAKVELIGNRSTLYQPLAGRIEIGNVVGSLYGEAYRKRPRFVMRDP